MTDQDAHLVRALRGLTVAAWSICGALIAMIALWTWMFLSGQRQMQHFEQSYRVNPPGTGAGPAASAPDEWSSGLPLNEKIARSSVLIVTKYARADGRAKAIITDIVKKRPDTLFHYAMGDEYELLSRADGKAESSEDGQVAFLAGSPAELRESYTYKGDRIGGLGDITVDEFRRRAQNGK